MLSGPTSVRPVLSGPLNFADTYARLRGAVPPCRPEDVQRNGVVRVAGEQRLDAAAHGHGGRGEHHDVRVGHAGRAAGVRGVGHLPRRGHAAAAQVFAQEVQGPVPARPDPLAAVLPRPGAPPGAAQGARRREPSDLPEAWRGGLYPRRVRASGVCGGLWIPHSRFMEEC